MMSCCRCWRVARAPWGVMATILPRVPGRRYLRIAGCPNTSVLTSNRDGVNLLGTAMLGVRAVADAVVFDMDGVLVESEHLWEELWAAFAAERGAQWGPEQTKSCQGMSAPEW